MKSKLSRIGVASVFLASIVSCASTDTGESLPVEDCTLHPEGAACATRDLDGDGVSRIDGDCDDGREDIFPGAVETCDAVDRNCDGRAQDELDCTGAPGDTDGDGLSDAEESFFGSNPAKVDTDGDGMSDYAEIKDEFDSTDPLVADAGPGDVVALAKDLPYTAAINGQPQIFSTLVPHLQPLKVEVKFTIDTLTIEPPPTVTPEPTPAPDSVYLEFTLKREGNRSRHQWTSCPFASGVATCTLVSNYVHGTSDYVGLVSADELTFKPSGIDTGEAGKFTVTVTYASYLDFGQSPMPHQDPDGDGFTALEGDCMDDPLDNGPNPKSPVVNPDALEFANDHINNNCKVDRVVEDPWSCTISFPPGYSVQTIISKTEPSTYGVLSTGPYGGCVVPETKIHPFNRYVCPTFSDVNGEYLGFRVASLPTGVLIVQAIAEVRWNDFGSREQRDCVVGE